jgi:hypothetical protein
MDTTIEELNRKKLEAYEHNLTVEAAETEIIHFENLVDLNKGIRDEFALCMKVWEWANPFCYWYKEPEFAERLTSWEDIQTTTKLTDKELDLLVFIHKNTDFSGAMCRSQLSKYKDRKKSRTLTTLVQKDAVKVIATEIVVNPSIMFGRDWYSPFYQGVLLSAYMNEFLVKVVLKKIDQEDRYFTHRGAKSSWLCIR